MERWSSVGSLTGGSHRGNEWLEAEVVAKLVVKLPPVVVKLLVWSNIYIYIYILCIYIVVDTGVGGAQSRRPPAAPKAPLVYNQLRYQVEFATLR